MARCDEQGRFECVLCGVTMEVGQTRYICDGCLQGAMDSDPGETEEPYFPRNILGREY